jgi:NAD(P)H-dependent FMN reductase
MKIGILLGSVRENRNGESVAKWVLEYAINNFKETEFELVDLKNYNLPFLGSNATDEQVEAIDNWSKTMASFDGYIFITPEYNRMIPGTMKNALDFLKPELDNKPVGFVGYGGLGGLSAIETLRVSVAEQGMASVKTMLTFSLMADFENMSVFKPHAYHESNAKMMINQVILWAKALKTIR